MANEVTTNITSGSNNVPASSFATASTTPTANRVCFIAIASSGSSARNTPTVTGASATWTLVKTVDINSIAKLTILMTYNASPGTGALTIDFGGQSQDRCAWILDDFTNTRITGTNGANAVKQSASNSGASVSTLAATLAAFASTQNGTYGATLTQNVPTNSIAPGSGFTETAEVDMAAGDFMSIETEFRLDNSTTVNSTSSSSSSHYGVIGIELSNVSTESSTGAAFLEEFV